MILILSFVIILPSGCWMNIDSCEESIKHCSDLEIEEFIIEKINRNGNIIRLEGKKSKSKEQYYFSDVSSWYFVIGDKFKIGDTLVKQKGEPIMRIYRKGERWELKYHCSFDSTESDIKKISVPVRRNVR